MANCLGRFVLRARPSDLANIETVAAALRAAGNPYTTRADAVRASLAAAAADPQKVIAAAAAAVA